MHSLRKQTSNLPHNKKNSNYILTTLHSEVEVPVPS